MEKGSGNQLGFFKSRGDMAMATFLNIFDDVAAAKTHARRMVDQGFDVTVSGPTATVSVNQTISGSSTIIPITAAPVNYVVMAYNQS
jgi:hypothetical protein